MSPRREATVRGRGAPACGSLSDAVYDHRERTILKTLAAAPVETWHRPMNVGGTGSSNHSYRLKKLVKRGFVEERLRGTMINFFGIQRRGSYEYRITDVGRKLVTNDRMES